MSTVGYGDFSPTTVLGRIFGCIFIVYALAMFASFTPEIVEIVTSRSIYAGRYHKETGKRHVVVCGDINYASVRSLLTDFLHEDREDKDVDVVFINRARPDIQLQGELKRNFTRVYYFEGTVMSSRDCHRVVMETADACLILANKYACDPDTEDAANLMRVVSVKNYCPRVRIVVQILQYHNKSFVLNIPSWNWRQGDDAVCLAQLKLGFLAQNSIVPGISTMLANLFAMRSFDEANGDKWIEHYLRGSSMEIYTGIFAPSFEGMAFMDAFVLCYEALGILLFAVKVNESDADADVAVEVNPDPNMSLTSESRGYFICFSQEDARKAQYLCLACASNANAKRGECKCDSHKQYKATTKWLEEFKKDRSFKIERARSTIFGLSRADLNPIPTLRTTNRKTQGVSKPDNVGNKYVDTTGLYYWESKVEFDTIVLTREASVSHFSDGNHVIVCIFADEDSPPMGLRNFAMPLRASNIAEHELKRVLFIGNVNFIEREWQDVWNFGGLYVLPGQPTNRSILRAAHVDKCAMCVVISARSRSISDSPDPYLVDKEVIMATLNIKSMRFCGDRAARGKTSRTAHESVHRCGEPTIPIITGLLIDSNIPFLEQDDEDDGDTEVFMTQAFSCGKAFTDSVLDSLLSAAYFNRNAMILIRMLITGGASPEYDSILAEGSGVEGVPINDELRKIQGRSSIQQIPYTEDMFGNSMIYGDVVMKAYTSMRIICIGVYRIDFEEFTSETNGCTVLLDWHRRVN